MEESTKDTNNRDEQELDLVGEMESSGLWETIPQDISSAP
jgi:hypothetical protein